MILIRREEPGDYARVYQVVKRAFALAEHSDGGEQDLVERLRKSAAFIPALSLVALDGASLVGHILFTRIGLEDVPAVALAPLAVLPEYQRQGIGSALVREGHRIAQALGYEWSVVLGSERYYPRLGYRAASGFGIYAPFDAPDENYMAYRLRGNGKGFDYAVVQYAKEFFEA